MLAAGILSGGNPSSTFTQGMGDSGNIHKTRAYMVFILAFVAIMSIVVSLKHHRPEVTSQYTDPAVFQRFTGSTLYLIARLFTA